jgi:hypothetical protein
MLPNERAAWSERFSVLDRELRQRRDGYNEAVLALVPFVARPALAGVVWRGSPPGVEVVDLPAL